MTGVEEPRSFDGGSWSVPRQFAFAAVLATAMGAGTFPGYAFGVLAPHLVTEFDLSRLQLGLLSTAFFLVGGGLSLSAGRAVDRMGARRILLRALAVLSVCIIAMAGSSSFVAIVGLAAVSGIALATANPATNKLVATLVPVGRRGWIMGTKQAGVQFGAFLAGALLGPLSSVVGWRLAFAGCALLPLGTIATGLWAVPADKPDRDVRGTAAWLAVFARVRWLMLYACLMGIGTAATMAYLPLFLVETSGLTVTGAGLVMAVVGSVGVIGRIAWAPLSERMGSYWIPLALFGAGGVLGLALIMATLGGTPWLAYAAAVVIGGTALTWNSVGMLAVLSISDRQSAGQASGMVLFGFYIGFVGSPVTFGWIVDSSGTYLLGWVLLATAYGCAAVIAAWRHLHGSPGSTFEAPG